MCFGVKELDLWHQGTPALHSDGHWAHLGPRRAARKVSLAWVTAAFRLGCKGSTESPFERKEEGTLWSRGLRFLMLPAHFLEITDAKEQGLARLGARRWRRRHAGVRYLRWVHWHFVYDLQKSQQCTQSHAAQWREHRGMTKWNTDQTPTHKIHTVGGKAGTALCFWCYTQTPSAVSIWG